MGISESAYNVRDSAHTYQYRGFGVPDLALKRGLSRELVVAPYATVLAMMVEPHQAMRNLAVLEAEGALGPYGFRDAIDYTRPVPGSRKAVVSAYMAHHIGMSIVAFDNALNGKSGSPLSHGSDRALGRADSAGADSAAAGAAGCRARRRADARSAETEKPAVRELETPTRRNHEWRFSEIFRTRLS